MKFLNIKDIVNILFLLFCALCVNSLALDDESGSFLFYMPMAFKYVKKASYLILVLFQLTFIAQLKYCYNNDQLDDHFRSMQISWSPLISELALRGHNITIIASREMYRKGKK